MTTWLIDTGPLVAYLLARDPAHDGVSACLDDFTGQLATSSAVVTEAMHFVAAAPAGPRRVLDFLHATATAVYDLSTPPALDDVVTLMERYHDTPMDYADGTLVRLAEALDVYDCADTRPAGVRDLPRENATAPSAWFSTSPVRAAR